MAPAPPSAPAQSPRPGIPHGRSGYDRHGCRCEVCRQSNTEHVRAVRARRKARLDASPSPESDPGHGTTGGYDAGCRCEACRLTRQSRYWREEGSRPHRWRERVTETYHAARDAWERLRESSTVVAASAVRGAAGAVVSAFQIEDEEFSLIHPPPTLGSVMVGLRGT